MHLLSAVVWVGGMFLAYMVVRPASGALEPPQRLILWRGLLSRFFQWVWLAILLLLASGYGMIYHEMGGMPQVGMHVHVMQAIGWVMFALFGHLYFVPWRRFKKALAADDRPGAASQLEKIRRIVAANLVLGLIVVVVGSTGRFWG